MGRAARLARQLGPIDNRGDAGRIVMAHGTCNQVLCGDLRVQEHYRLWRAAHDAWRVDPRTADLRRRGLTEAQMAAAVARADVEALAAVLRPMGVPWRWCAEALIGAYFPLMRWNEQHPDDQRGMQVSADSAGLPLGRLPRHRGQDVTQWVRWWYRHRIKQPADSIYKLAQEYAARENRLTRADSVVEDGIQRGETLLNRVMPSGGHF
jgi:hypothetical protein